MKLFIRRMASRVSGLLHALIGSVFIRFITVLSSESFFGKMVVHSTFIVRLVVSAIAVVFLVGVSTIGIIVTAIGPLMIAALSQLFVGGIYRTGVTVFTRKTVTAFVGFGLLVVIIATIQSWSRIVAIGSVSSVIRGVSVGA